VQSDALKNSLGIPGQGFQFIVGSCRICELDEFYLIELVLPDQTAGVFAVGTRFAAKAGRIRCELLRQCSSIQNLPVVEIGQRDFCRRDQIVIRPLDPKEVLGKLRQKRLAELAINGGSTSRYPCS